MFEKEEVFKLNNAQHKKERQIYATSFVDRVKEFRKDTVKKYTGYGYHGGGRKPTGIKRASISISGQPEELEQLKANAKAAGYATTSKFIIDMLVHKYPGITSQHSEDAE